VALDDNTLDNAGEAGRALADDLAAKIIEVVEGLPLPQEGQQAAILRIVANTLYDHADGMEA
jgi:hypothetical protein